MSVLVGTKSTVDRFLPSPMLCFLYTRGPMLFYDEDSKMVFVAMKVMCRLEVLLTDSLTPPSSHPPFPPPPPPVCAIG